MAMQAAIILAVYEILLGDSIRFLHKVYYLILGLS